VLARGWQQPVACFLCGTLSLVTLPWITSQAHYAYWAKEPYFSSPIPMRTAFIPLRNDGYGKGAFGASRSGNRKHQGIDLLAETGTPVLSSKSGRILYAGTENGYGNYVVILHPDGFSTCYAHLSQLSVVTGDWVEQGSVIGRSGKTGNAAKTKILPHLHFEIRYAGQPLDPGAGWMSPHFTFSKATE